MGLDLLRKGEVDESDRRSRFQARADGDQLGRKVADRVISRLAVRLAAGPFADVGRIKATGIRVFVMDQERQQGRGIAGTFDQHALGPQFPDEPAHVPGAGRAVMTNREVDDPRGKIDGRG